MTDAELREARLLLPFYANETIDAAARRRVDACLEASADLRAELQWLRAVRRDVKSAEAGVAADDDLGLASLLARLEDERPSNVVPITKPGRPRWQRPALALAASLLLGQAIVIGVLVGERDEGYRPLSGPVAATGSLLQVRFQPTATEAQIRAVLQQAAAELVAGPGALGVYTVRVAPENTAGALRSLSDRRDVIESVNVVPR